MPPSDDRERITIRFDKAKLDAIDRKRFDSKLKWQDLGHKLFCDWLHQNKNNTTSTPVTAGISGVSLDIPSAWRNHLAVIAKAAQSSPGLSTLMTSILAFWAGQAKRWHQDGDDGDHGAGAPATDHKDSADNHSGTSAANRRNRKRSAG